MRRKIVSVWEINQYVKSLIEEDYMLADVWLQGEISNCKYHQSGHIYFTIKDSRAAISAVMFERDARKVSFRLSEGMKVYARVRISLYEKTGGYQAYVLDVEKQGKGDLYEAFEKLKVILDNEGLFKEEYKKRLPKFPKNVGIITSHTGAAVRDIIQVARLRNPSIPLTIYPVHVQGEYAVSDIVEAISTANQEKRVDVIILGRGGGSIEDLWAFNEERVARAIFESDIPIVSAVGHEVDFTIADFVSDRRAATPSQAAEIVIPSQLEVIELIKGYQRLMKTRTETVLKIAKRNLESLVSRPVFVHKDMFYKNKMQEIDDWVQKMNYHYRLGLNKHEKRYELAIQNLERLSPLNTLKRGYSLVTKDQTIIKSIEDVEKGDKICLTVTDGTITAVVEDKEL